MLLAHISLMKLTVNAVSFPEEWRNYIVADLSNRGSIEQVWFLQHGAPAYFTLIVNEVLNEALPCWWTGHGSATSASPKSWPSLSPDLTAPDYSLWGIIKTKWQGITVTPHMLERCHKRMC